MIQAVGPGEAEKADFVLCMRTADLEPIDPARTDPLAAYERAVRARSHTEPCSGCGAELLVDSTSPKNPAKICMACARDIASNVGKPTS